MVCIASLFRRRVPTVQKEQRAPEVCMCSLCTCLCLLALFIGMVYLAQSAVKRLVESNIMWIMSDTQVDPFTQVTNVVKFITIR